MARGTIKTLVQDKRFGFIRSDAGTEIFFHISGLQVGTAWEDLREELAVEFTETAGAKGPRAEGVRVVGG